MAGTIHGGDLGILHGLGAGAIQDGAGEAGTVHGTPDGDIMVLIGEAIIVLIGAVTMEDIMVIMEVIMATMVTQGITTEGQQLEQG